MAETLFVTTEWLNEHLQDDNLRVVDIRGRVLPATEPPPHYKSHHDEYKESHIPGAVFVDWTTDIVEPGSPSYDIANADRYAALMSHLGIGPQTQVVAYDDANGMFAARMWWTLRYYGHEQVAVLMGGWQQWVAEGRPTTANEPEVTPTTFVPQVNHTLRATADDIKGGNQLLDVRSVAEFTGEASRAQRMGHIPGAVNWPRKAMLDEAGQLLPAVELRGYLAELGIDDDQDDVIVYCNSGVSASFGLMALEAAGIRNGRVYDGSWKDWANNPDRPIE